MVAATRWAPSVVTIAGEAGIGKTRLVDELVTALRGEHWVSVRRAAPPRDRFPFGGIADLLNSFPHRLRGLSPVAGALRPYTLELADRLPPEPPRADNPRGARKRMFDAVHEVLRAMGRTTLILENTQWADKETLRLLRSLAVNPPPQLSMVLTYRPEDSGHTDPLGPATRAAATATITDLTLAPLDAAGVRDLATAIGRAGPASHGFAEALWERTGGLPSFVEEVVNTLSDRAALTAADRAAAERLLDESPVPPLVRQAMIDRLTGLPDHARTLAEAAAVVAAPVAPEVLSAIADGPASQLRRLVDRALLVEVAGGRYAYRFPLARKAVYESLAGPRRSLLHLRALHVLARTPSTPAIELAKHAKLAGSNEDWLRYGERAADEASAAGDDVNGTALLCELIAARPLPTQQVARLITTLCRNAMNGRQHETAIAALERLLVDFRMTEEIRAEISAGLGLLLIRKPGELAGSSRKIKSVARVSGTADQLGILRGLAALGMPYLGDRSIEECRRWQARIGSRISRMSPGTARTTLLASTLQSQLAIGDPSTEDMIALLPKRIASHDTEHARQLARALCNLGDVSAWMGHYRRARSWLRAGLRHATSAPYVSCTGAATMVRLDWLAGAWTGLEQRTRDLVEANPDGLPVVSEMRLVQGWLALARGDWPVAERSFLATRVAKPETAIAPVAIAAIGGLITLHLQRGDVRSAGAYADRGVALLRRQGVWAWAGELVPAAVEAMVADGRITTAQALVSELAGGLDTLDAPFPQAALTAARAQLALATEPASAAKLFDAAAAQYKSLKLPYYAAQATERSVQCGPVTCDTLLNLALEYEKLGATRAAARCRQLLRSTGITVPSRRGRRGYGNQLSPRELEIVPLLTAGQTNREIADALFLALRTVEDHVASILRKLGVQSRAELANT